ncbi:Phage-related baseplate assembly protein [Pasteurella testudinis DSM 23072]|uniref:Phage-related baseplate assembly protein n=1 Tax=Pasteurella testudinis DSM 23072 TaxID=1122938 RepID=A0A1W1UMT4_9PAST|nr:baseplate J/gp47 family protein [Pasteurella testudinis]SMB82397.1 Phage-related baseplate assembly protein [Pasteurella testudinis DSM 23072]SUB52219.1 Baseplate J-like protein [Pasteurella testudinis]
MSRQVDLSKLPAPQIIEELDFETLLAARKTNFINRFAADEQTYWAKRLTMESDPVTKLLEENTYLETLLRARINAAAKGVMLAYAIGSDLDQLGALYGVKRLIIQPADDSTNPPTEQIGESDDRLRQRIQLSLEGFTTAGPKNSYLFHTLTASSAVKDADISSPKPGTVQVTVLSTKGQGQADTALINTVKTTLNAEDVRPLTDTVLVQSATIVSYSINAVLTLYPSTAEAAILQQVNAAAQAFANEKHKLGHDITLSGIYAALHQQGVQNVKLTVPTRDLVIQPSQAGYCTAINITIGGLDE